jgi:peptidyl-tRNA hydrolase
MSMFPDSMITSRGEFHAAVREAFAEAARAGCREIWLVDIDFADWPLNEPQVIECLTQWAQAHRKLTLLAQNFDEIARRHARWIAWRRLWSHVVECRANNELEAGQMPTLLLMPGLVSLRLVDPVHYRGSVSRSEADTVRSRELIDAVLERSEEAFPVTSLGL